jgi:RNA polymerase sigma-70 factor (ECF subfamily)
LVNIAGDHAEGRLLDEAQLVVDSQRGDIQAFNLLVEHYQQRVFAVCYRMLGDADAAADATQDTFLSAYRSNSSSPVSALRWWR